MSPSAVVPIRLSNLLINRSGSGEVLGEEERNISTQAKYSRRKAKSQKVSERPEFQSPTRGLASVRKNVGSTF
ncbi:hypothetical protein AGABI2DRAFT_120110 [Agaricus bisporus var. bisporus H97]|uniref:hypothetical protein n=1 Tax=Agaricus bisporus var. bisporus (strain H97 / ATCC MYA-4626 / FGSC 10389) TaxID=936046 RepID=UPI00029F56BA|nr:hypothetical protein AGABI2DRAFT_120110 [Agaricus bisporus var. bisporus H97]EKV45145.1 hypothetical protein AGABI2DRAFT_120110 [Agaricus bisporus var. bisporus H97]